MKGLIIKGVGGFYYVKTEQGVYETRGRGIFRKAGISPVVGDHVEISELEEEGKGVLEKIYPRRNSFRRPPISNVDRIIIEMAARDPEPNFSTIDKLLIIAEKMNVEAAICINKADLVTEEELNELANRYEKACQVFRVSLKNKEGLEQVEDFIRDHTAALEGASGVGKSSMVNFLLRGEAAEIGHVSRKNKRGRQTTRHVEMFELASGGWIFDTPGFSSFDMEGELLSSELDKYYPEFRDYIGQCRFDNCRHLSEPGCAVKAAVEAGEINSGRYKTYTEIFEEIKQKENKY